MEFFASIFLFGPTLLLSPCPDVGALVATGDVVATEAGPPTRVAGSGPWRVASNWLHSPSRWEEGIL